MSGVFQDIDPPPLSPHGECVLPAFVACGGHTRWVERGVAGQYFVRRQTQLCTLQYICKYFVVCPLVGIGTPPPPLPPASVYPPEPKEVGNTGLRVRGWGSLNSDDWRDRG